MSERQYDTVKYDSAETNEMTVSIGEIAEDFQIIAKDTGWSEEEKGRMKQFGYDGLDMARAWIADHTRQGSQKGRHFFMGCHSQKSRRPLPSCKPLVQYCID